MSTMSKKKTKGTPTAVDKHVGQRLSLRRSLNGFSQEKLAEFVGVTFQQIQKYEKGTNRISAGRLYHFSKALNVPISYFFDDIDSDTSKESNAFLDKNIMQSKETLKLVQIYYAEPDPTLRKSIIKFIKAMTISREKSSPKQ